MASFKSHPDVAKPSFPPPKPRPSDTRTDVLIRPKRSTLKSRSEVTVERQFKFKHSPKVWTGVPIMVSEGDRCVGAAIARGFCPTADLLICANGGNPLVLFTHRPPQVANMDTTGTFEIAKAAATHKIVTCIHKHYTPEQWGEFAAANESTLEYVAASAGSSDSDFEKVRR